MFLERLKGPFISYVENKTLREMPLQLACGNGSPLHVMLYHTTSKLIIAACPFMFYKGA